MVVPFISREDIRAALDSLIHSTHKPGANGLHRLLLVDLALAAPDMPDSDAARDYAVRDLLVNEIVTALNEQRALFNLLAVDTRASFAKTQEEIDNALTVGARELVIWNALYYRYVRSDLDLSVEELAKLLAVHIRTLPRYLDDAFDLLTQRVIKAEHEARRAQLKRYLLAALPYSVPLRLIGREELIEAAEKYVTTLSPRHILITGSAGVGKTVFTQELLRRQIEADALDHLIWLDQPASADDVRQEVIARLLREDSQVTLRDYLLLYRVAIVLDGIDTLTSDRETFGALLRDFGAAQLFLVNRTAVAQEVVAAHITMPELDFTAAAALVKDVLRREDVQIGDETAHAIYDTVGGAPLALRLAVALWEQGHDWSTLRTEIQERLLERLYAAFDEPIRQAWLALALMPDHAQFDALTDLLGVSEHSLYVLAQHALLTASVNDRDASRMTYTLVGGAREFIRRRRDSGETAGALLNALAVDSRSLDVFEYALVSGFPPVPPEQRTTWVKALWRDGLRSGHWALWRRILEAAAHDFESVELRTAYGVCLRRLGEWESAEQVFYAVVSECGRDGRFDDQARALLEWGILARYQGNYERAQGFFAQAKRFAERAREDHVLWAVSLQQAQVYVEAGDGAEALKLLVGLPETALSLALSGEAHFTLGNHEMCRTQAERSRRLSGIDLSAQASLLSLIGRSHQAQGDLAQARAYLSETVSLLERLSDVFALARAQSNLAGILMPLGQLTDASQLLTSAEQIQKRLGDRVGLSATRHNRAILGGYIAR